jgi:hypothetical protein
MHALFYYITRQQLTKNGERRTLQAELDVQSSRYYKTKANGNVVDVSAQLGHIQYRVQ